MQTRTLLAIAILVLLAASPAAAQEDWNITGAGARAEGLGGAFIGLADDATAISWNPAGLGQLERSEFSVVGRWIGEEYKHDNPANKTNNYTINQSHFTYNFASIAFPLHAGKVNIVPAVAFQKQLDNFQKYDVTDESYESGGGVNTLTPGIGVKLFPMLYVGGAVNIWLGNFDNKTTDKSVTPNDVWENNGSYKGLNFSAGLLVDFEGLKTPVPIKVGATVRTPFELEVDGDYKYLSGTQTTGEGKFKNTVEVPLMFGVGASGRIGENLTLAFDFETRLYSDKKIFRAADEKTFDTLDLSASKTDLNQIRVGAEYLIVTSAGVIPIRAGFRTVPTLRANWNIQDKPDGQVSGNGFTVGTGFIGGAIALDVTYSRMTWEQKFVLTSTNTSTNNYTSQTVSVSAIIYF
jgi:long-subunit fatty acid transport protein